MPQNTRGSSKRGNRNNKTNRNNPLTRVRGKNLRGKYTRKNILKAAQNAHRGKPQNNINDRKYGNF